MSWGIYYPCCYCQKRDQGCRDFEHISDGIGQAHGAEAIRRGEHLGGGTVVMACCNIEPYRKSAPPERE